MELANALVPGDRHIETPGLGDGKPDTFLYDPRIDAYHAVEIKRPKVRGRHGRPIGGGRLTPDQRKTHSTKRILIIDTPIKLRQLLGLWE